MRVDKFENVQRKATRGLKKHDLGGNSEGTSFVWSKEKKAGGWGGNSALVHKGCCEEERHNLPSASTGDRSRSGGVQLPQRKCIKIF